MLVRGPVAQLGHDPQHRYPTAAIYYAASERSAAATWTWGWRYRRR